MLGEKLGTVEETGLGITMSWGGASGDDAHVGRRGLDVVSTGRLSR